MTYKIKYHRSVIDKDLRKLSDKTKKRIFLAIKNKLIKKPMMFGKALRHSLKGHRSLRVGVYRILFKIKGNCIYILAIQHRSIIYGNSDARF